MMEWLFFGLIALGLVGVYFSTISFPLFMILILVLTGIIWLVDYFFFQKKRPTGTADPTVVEYAKSFFPVIFLVFMIRSFVAEPFKIPSGSMMPTLLAGDYILVNKYTYGLRVPLANNVFYAINQPKRGDVVVFHFPPNPKIDYIKRVIGLPGDTIAYQDKQLTINGEAQKVTYLSAYDYMKQGYNILPAERKQEQLGSLKHDILNLPFEGASDSGIGAQFSRGETITVPAGHYFAMGDNRDDSADGRVWGFVPEKNLVGKAFFIWFNFDRFDRIGNAVN